MAPRDRWLLPEGIEETLPSEARRLEALRRDVLDLFERWGYELVMPPLIEFLDALLTGVGRDMDLQTFKVTDQLTGRLMGIRADMTPQAARIDAHYLKREGAVRLCYLGPVLRTRPEDLAGSREPMQLGAELFGHRGPESDAEVLSLMLATLALAGIPRPHVDLAHVGVFRGLTEAAGLDGERRDELFDALQRKARSEVQALLRSWSVPGDLAQAIVGMLDLNGGADVLGGAREAYAAWPRVIEAIAELEAIARRANAESPDAEICFDLAELGGYHYYTGAMFSAFVPGRGRAVAKGGRYDGIGRAFGRDRAATGFGADLRELMRAGESPVPRLRGIVAPADEDSGLAAEIARLRAAGERVVRRLPGDAASAADLGCDRALVKHDGRWTVSTLS